MMPWLEAETATFSEVTDFIRQHPFALLPVGATEQHGPHLPLSTDTLLAAAYTREIAKQAGGLVLPALPFGYSWTWRNIAGTMTLAFDTFLSVVYDLAASAQRSGVRALAIVSGHEANRQPLKYALRERIVDQLGLPVLNIFYPGLGRILSEADSKPWSSGMLHAEEFETSLMLHSHPTHVRSDLAVADYPEAPLYFGQSSETMGDIMNSGVFGDATVASAEKGARWLAMSADEGSRLWSTFLIDHGLLTRQEE